MARHARLNREEALMLVMEVLIDMGATPDAARDRLTVLLNRMIDGDAFEKPDGTAVSWDKQIELIEADLKLRRGGTGGLDE